MTTFFDAQADLKSDVALAARSREEEETGEGKEGRDDDEEALGAWAAGLAGAVDGWPKDVSFEDKGKTAA